MSLSARRAWIEIPVRYAGDCTATQVALRKESVDRNTTLPVFYAFSKIVALRKESVDRNNFNDGRRYDFRGSLSARRAWIEISA